MITDFKRVNASGPVRILYGSGRAAGVGKRRAELVRAAYPVIWSAYAYEATRAEIRYILAVEPSGSVRRWLEEV